MTFGPIVTADWLRAQIGAADLKIIDASWRLPGQGDAIEAHRAAHIPGAVFFPLDEIADRTTDLPHMLPAPDAFAAAVGAMGVRESDRVVVYDDKGLFSAPRVWWTFRAMGHERVAVLDGGLPAWIRAGGETSAEIAEPAPVPYLPRPDRACVCDADAVRAAIISGAAEIVDARPADRFSGAAAEPRPGLRAGHMPGAKSLPFTRLLGDAGGLASPADIAAAFAAADVDLAKPVVASCGSGVTAAVLYLALDIIGHEQHAVYDGSWAEWGDERNQLSRFPVQRDHVG